MSSSKTRFSLRKKTVLIIVAMAIVLSGAALYVSQQTFSRNNDDRFRAQATELADTVSAVIDAEKVSALRAEVAAIYDNTEVKIGSEMMGTPEYSSYIQTFIKVGESDSFRALYTVLRSIQNANDVESIYIIYVDVPTASTVYLVDASDEPCLPGNFDPVYEENKAVLTNPEVGFPAYITNTPEYGWLVSAGVPIHDGSGVCAYAFVDISMNAVKRTEHTFMISLSILLLALTVGICTIYILVVNRVLIKPVNRLSKAASSYYDSGTQTKNSFSALDIHTGDEIENLSHAMKQMEQDMNVYIHDLTAVTAEKERISAELNIATQIQADMLPRIFPPFPERHEFDLYASMHPAKEVGGDFYDFFLVDDDHICLVMADVSGKGVPAALFMVIAKTLIKNRAQMGDSPAELLANVNEQLCQGNDAELFVTVWLAVIQLSTGHGVAANAGHEHPVIKRKGGKYELAVYRHSPAVATMDGIRFREHTFELNKGDSLFVYTDGVPEATNYCNELFGTDRMLSSLNRDPDANPQELLQTVRGDIDAFVGGAPQFDDITMLSFQYAGTEEKNLNELTIEARVENLDQVLSFVDGYLEQIDCPMKAKMQIDVAVEELYVNIANYAYNPSIGTATVRVEILQDPLAVSITFIDHGVPYDPLKKPDPDVTLSAEERQIGGLGIYMVKKSMDGIEYEYKDGQNILKIKKNFG